MLYFISKTLHENQLFISLWFFVDYNFRNVYKIPRPEYCKKSNNNHENKKQKFNSTYRNNGHSLYTSHRHP